MVTFRKARRLKGAFAVDLPNGLSAYNPWGQELELKLKKGSPKNPIEGLVVSKGGEPVDLKLAQ